MNNIKKIILSNKQIINELRNLTENNDARLNYVERLDFILKKSLPKDFLFIESVEINPKEKEYGYQNDTFILIEINLIVDVSNLPNYKYLREFVKYYYEEKMDNQVRFSDLKYYYKDEYEEIGEKLTKLVNQDIDMYVNNLFHLFDVDEMDFHTTTYFKF